jgi:hypothetical protein
VRAARGGARFEAIECLREAIHFTKGRYEDKVARGTKLRHDHGSQWIIGRIGYRTPAAHRRILLGEAA